MRSYLAMSLRNVGAGMAVIHGWHADAELHVGLDDHAPVEQFRPQQRDLYVPPNDSSFWQGAFRENDPDERAAFGDLIGRQEPFTIELLYGDLEGGQRTVSRLLRGALRRRRRSEQLARERHPPLEPRPLSTPADDPSPGCVA